LNGYKFASLLYGCETWSLTLREDNRTRVFESRVLREIFGPNREELTRKRGRLYKEELYDFYSSPNIIRVIKTRRVRWTGCMARSGERKKALGRPRRRWGNSVKMIFKNWDGSVD
jgi:hypothetical protein